MAIYRLIDGQVIDVDFTGQRLINGTTIVGQASGGSNTTIEVPLGPVWSIFFAVIALQWSDNLVWW